MIDGSMWLHAGFWFAGFFVWFRFRKIADASCQEEPVPSVSVIIPARNERDRLPDLLESLKQQSLLPKEVIVVDDHSTDGTGEMAAQMKAHVLISRPLPEKWLGKPWACHQGALKAGGELLVFLDADVMLEKKGLENIAAAHMSLGGALSILPYHNMKSLIEELSAFFNLIQAAASNAFTMVGANTRLQKPFGPVLIVSKKDYLKCGGHEAVKNSVVENYSLAVKFREHEIPLRCFIGKGVVNFRMYAGGFKEIVNGWNKSFASGARGAPPFVFIGIVLWLTGGLGTARHLVTSLTMGQFDALPWLAAFYSLYVFQIHGWLSRLGNFGFLTSLLFPIPAIFFVFVFLKSMFFLIFRRPATWKGRKVSS